MRGDKVRYPHRIMRRKWRLSGGALDIYITDTYIYAYNCRKLNQSIKKIRRSRREKFEDYER